MSLIFKYRRISLVLLAVVVGLAITLVLGIARSNQRRQRQFFAAVGVPALPAADPPLRDPPTCLITRHAVIALADVARQLRVGMGHCGQNLAGGDWKASEGWRRMALAAVASVAVLEPSELSVAERLIAQNAALRVGICGPIERDPSIPGPPVPASARSLAVAVARLVQRLALPHESLRAIGEEPGHEIDRWLGDPRDRIDRKAVLVPLFHERGYGFTRMFRILEVRDSGANFSRLLAVDKDWRPHITPIIGEVEIRRPFRTRAQGQLVFELDVAQAGCAPKGALRPVDPQQLHGRSDFIFPAGPNRLGCNTCHSRGPIWTEDLPPQMREDHLRKRREMFLGEATKAVQTLRRWLP